MTVGKPRTEDFTVIESTEALLSGKGGSSGARAEVEPARMRASSSPFFLRVSFTAFSTAVGERRLGTVESLTLASSPSSRALRSEEAFGMSCKAEMAFVIASSNRAIFLDRWASFRCLE